MDKTVHIIGAGTAGILAAVLLARKGLKPIVYDANGAAGRKFLVAGGGGLNITHSESPETFINRYTPYHFLEKAFKHYNNLQFIEFLKSNNLPVYTGSSGRVFPNKKLKPIEVLNKLLDLATKAGAEFRFKHTFVSMNEQGCHLNTPNGPLFIKGHIIYALGGASWSVTGSNGKWMECFKEAGFTVEAFEGSNCKMLVNWPKDIVQNHLGKPLKNTAFKCGPAHSFGEAVITRDGLEGSGIYPLSPTLRNALKEGKALLHMNFVSRFDEPTLQKILKAGEKNLSAQLLQRLSLSRQQLAIVKNFIAKEDFTNISKLSVAIKKIEIAIEGVGPMDESISVAGGLSLSEVDNNFELYKRKNQFAIGEMLAYDAPTGGYLIQSCYTMAAQVAEVLAHRLG